MIVYPVYVFVCFLPVTILFFCHGNIKFKKKKNYLNDNSCKTTEALWL